MDPGKVRAEKVLASTISIDGRQEWARKFCSESNAWTRWRCRRCYHGIPAGLRGKYRQAIAARRVVYRLFDVKRRGRQKIRSFEPGFRPWREGVPGGQGLPSRKREAWRKSGEWTRTLRRISRAAQSLDDHKKGRVQKE